MDVFSLVMAFLTSTTSLAAALVQYQTAKIAASAAEGAGIAASAAEGARRIIARPDAKKTPIGVLGAKKRFFSRLWGEKFANFSPQ